MSETGTSNRKVLRRSSDRQVFARIAPPAGFLSQTILSRAAPRSAPEVIGAYTTGSRIAIRRLPPGYRRTIDV